MKNQSLKNNLTAIVGNPKIVVTKGNIGGNSIEVCINEPVYEDLGSFIYYERESDRDADLSELNKLISKKNG